MKTVIGVTLKIFIFIFLCAGITSCEDPLELKNPINNQLDSEIENRIQQLQQQIAGKSQNILPAEIHKDITQLSSRINTFDESSLIAKKTDAYFEKIKGKFCLSDSTFIILSIS